MWGGTHEAESIATDPAGIEHGINVIDTAPAYGFGCSEEIVGKAIALGSVRDADWCLSIYGRQEGSLRIPSRARILQEIDAVPPAASNRPHRHDSGALGGIPVIAID